MATKTFEELKQLAIQIRDEKTNKQNTATRVGTEMLEHLNKLEQDYYDKTTINNRTSEYNVSLNHPTSGLSGSNKYDLLSAIAQVPAELRSFVNTVSFLNEDGNTEKWEFAGGSWRVSNFSQVGAEKLTELENKSIINNGYLTGDFFTIPRCCWNNKGELSALESCKCTPFIPFKKGDELIANGTTKSAGFDNCNFFDKYNVFISSITIQSSQEELVVKEYNTPENTRFITLNALLEAETSVEINGINNIIEIGHKVFNNTSSISELNGQIYNPYIYVGKSLSTNLGTYRNDKGFTTSIIIPVKKEIK